MALNWKVPFGTAVRRLHFVSRCLAETRRASWYDLAAARANLVEARKAIDEAIKRLDETKSLKKMKGKMVVEVNKHNLCVYKKSF